MYSAHFFKNVIFFNFDYIIYTDYIYSLKFFLRVSESVDVVSKNQNITLESPTIVHFKGAR